MALNVQAILIIFSTAIDLSRGMTLLIMGLLCLFGVLSNHASSSICLLQFILSERWLEKYFTPNDLLFFKRNFKLLKGGVGGYGFMLRPPSAQMVHAITQKGLDGLFSNLVHTVVVIVPRTEQLFMVRCQRSSSQHHKNWLFLSFLEFLLPHFVPKQGVRGIGIPSPTDKSFCPFVSLSHVQVLVHLQANHWSVWAQIWSCPT